MQFACCLVLFFLGGRSAQLKLALLNVVYPVVPACLARGCFFLVWVAP